MAESPCHLVIWGKMPDTTVNDPTPTPMAIDNWWGLKRRVAPSVLAGALGLLITTATLLAVMLACPTEGLAMLRRQP
jgi:hypothetical protein